MQALLSPLRELAEYDSLKETLRKGKGPIALTGCVDSQKLHMIYGLSDGIRIKVIVTYSDLKARELYEEYKFYDRNAMLYPAKDLIFFSGRHSWKSIGERACQNNAPTDGEKASYHYHNLCCTYDTACPLGQGDGCD